MDPNGLHQFPERIAAMQECMTISLALSLGRPSYSLPRGS